MKNLKIAGKKLALVLMIILGIFSCASNQSNVLNNKAPSQSSSRPPIVKSETGLNAQTISAPSAELLKIKNSLNKAEAAMNATGDS